MFFTENGAKWETMMGKKLGPSVPKYFKLIPLNISLISLKIEADNLWLAQNNVPQFSDYGQNLLKIQQARIIRKKYFKAIPVLLFKTELSFKMKPNKQFSI